jgi:hypothetical protein
VAEDYLNLTGGRRESGEIHPLFSRANALTEAIIGAAIEVQSTSMSRGRWMESLASCWRGGPLIAGLSFCSLGDLL